MDVECGQEVRPRHYIRSILPGGPVDREGSLCRGDELLEVNGQRLKGLFHDQVVSVLRKVHATTATTLVCGRRLPRSGEPSPIRGTIVNNMEVGHSRKAFDSRVSKTTLPDSTYVTVMHLQLYSTIRVMQVTTFCFHLC